MFKLIQVAVKAFVICFSFMVLFACVGIKAGTHFDENHFFHDYKTFSWVSKQPISKVESGSLKISPLTMKKIVHSIQSELESKGYHYIADNEKADFGLTYTVGSRQEINMSSFPVDYRHNWGWYWYGNHHAFNQWHTQTWTEGTLTIDIFDNNNKEPIWHGWATKTVSSSDRKDPTDSIELAVRKIFKDFPVSDNNLDQSNNE